MEYMIERKDRSHIFISTCTKAVFDKVQHSLTKVLETLEIDKAYLRILKPICSNLISNTILNKEKLRTFPVKSGTRLDVHFHFFQFNMVLQVLNYSKKTTEKHKISGSARYNIK